MVESGLLPLVRKEIKFTNITEFAHKKAAVDESDWIFEACKSCANIIANNEMTIEYMHNFMDRTQLLLENDIIFIIVFDSCDLPVKSFQIEKLHQYRCEQFQVAKRLEKNELLDDANNNYRNYIKSFIPSI